MLHSLEEVVSYPFGLFCSPRCSRPTAVVLHTWRQISISFNGPAISSQQPPGSLSQHHASYPPNLLTYSMIRIMPNIKLTNSTMAAQNFRVSAESGWPPPPVHPSAAESILTSLYITDQYRPRPRLLSSLLISRASTVSSLHASIIRAFEANLFGMKDTMYASIVPMKLKIVGVAVRWIGVGKDGTRDK